MKDFAKILEEALMERDETLKQQRELAEEIIESALKQFSNVDVREIIISYNEQNEILVVDPGAGGIETKYSDLCYGKVVYGSIEDILSSDDEEINDLKDKIIIMIKENDPKSITFKLEEDA